MNNKQKIKPAVITAIFLNIIFTACKTTQKPEIASNLSILILDENDRAVQDYSITLAHIKKNEKQESLETTNQTGLCVFYDLMPDEYILSGKKSGYTQMPVQPLKLDNNSELYCFRVYSADYIFDYTEQLYDDEQFQKALELLESICTERNPALQNTVSFYKAYGYAKLGQKEKAGLELQKLKEFDNPAFETSRYCEAIEKMIFAN